MYENSVDYSSVASETTKGETKTTSQQDYLFDWSCLVDASLEFYNPEVKKKSHIRCVFTRVYIDDMDLLFKGDDYDEEAVVDEVDSKEDLLEDQFKEDSTTNLNKEEDNVVIEVKNEKLQNELNSSNNADFKNNPYKMKRRRFCQDFENNVRNFGFSTGFDLDETDYNNKNIVGSETGSDKSSSFGAGVLDYAKYWVNRNIKKSAGYESRRRKKAQTAQAQAAASSSSATTSSLQISNSNTSVLDESDGDDSSLNISMGKLSFDDKLKFDFAFDPKRDRKLIAKRARKYFSDDKEMMKYWFQRYRYFSKLDEGILLDREAWFSVTPEMLAQHVADRLVRIKDCIILDSFAGSGGNTIQFALKGAFVYAIDIDPVKLRCSSRNARIYGVRDRINFICGDFFNICKSLYGARKYKEDNKIVKSSFPYTTDLYPFAIDAVYLSPPWGGPSYNTKSDREGFDLKNDIVLDGVKIFNYAKKISKNIVYFLPKNTCVNQLVGLASSDGEVELEQGMLGEKIKALHAYYGKLVAHD